jgi:hypothetical protein
MVQVGDILRWKGATNTPTWEEHGPDWRVFEEGLTLWRAQSIKTGHTGVISKAVISDDWWEVLPPETKRSPGQWSTTRVERPCPNVTCGRPNDEGSHTCWWCGGKLGV